MSDSLALRDGFTPELLGRFREYLAETSDLAEVKRLHDGAEAYRRFTDKRDEQRLAAIGAIWAAFRGGELLATNPDLTTHSTSVRLTEVFRGSTQTQAENLSSRWQRLYAKEKEAVQAYIDAAEWPSFTGAIAAHGGKPPTVPTFPPGVFAVLYADPPWRYEGNLSERQSRGIEQQYDSMDVADIVALTDSSGHRVQDLATEAAILFLWATSPKLQEALMVMDGWGFDYKTCAVWVKDRIGPGYTFRQRHELLLVGKRGSMPTPPQSTRPDSVIEAPRKKHSEKPEVVYELIERMYPDIPKVELFARNARPGWTAWGNEA